MAALVNDSSISRLSLSSKAPIALKKSAGAIALIYYASPIALATYFHNLFIIFNFMLN
jgi:hypothetical protein